MNLEEKLQEAYSEENTSDNKESKNKKYKGKIFPIYNNDRIEKKQILKNISRNDKCFCGSGKKYKKCCWGHMFFENSYELKSNS